MQDTHDRRARRAVEEIVRESIAHERATKGTLFPDVRAHEIRAQEIARRNDRRRAEEEDRRGAAHELNTTGRASMHTVGPAANTTPTAEAPAAAEAPTADAVPALES